MKIDIEIKDQKALQALNILARRGDDLSPAMQAIAGVLADNIEQAFQSEQSPEGEVWALLSDTTIKRREKSGYWPGQKLQQTGRLAEIVSHHLSVRITRLRALTLFTQPPISLVPRKVALVVIGTVVLFLGAIFQHVRFLVYQMKVPVKLKRLLHDLFAHR